MFLKYRENDCFNSTILLKFVLSGVTEPISLVGGGDGEDVIGNNYHNNWSFLSDNLVSCFEKFFYQLYEYIE